MNHPCIHKEKDVGLMDIAGSQDLIFPELWWRGQVFVNSLLDLYLREVDGDRIELNWKEKKKTKSDSVKDLEDRCPVTVAGEPGIEGASFTIDPHGGCQVNGPKVAKFLDR